jgi:hypothetical protein
MQYLQHTKQERRQIKDLKHVSKTLAKACEKHFKTITPHTQHPDKIFATYM